MLDTLINSKLKRRLLNTLLNFPVRSFSMAELRAATGGGRNIGQSLKELMRGDAVRLSTKKRKQYFQINPYFPLYDELKDLVEEEKSVGRDEVSQLLRRLDQAKLAILSGVFTAQPHLPVDLLLVGDKMKRPKVARVVDEIERLAEQEINYVIMGSQEYDYRRMMSDRLIRDVLDNPHQIVFNSFKK